MLCSSLSLALRVSSGGGVCMGVGWGGGLQEQSERGRCAWAHSSWQQRRHGVSSVSRAQVRGGMCGCHDVGCCQCLESCWHNEAAGARGTGCAGGAAAVHTA